jgi:hypothetical protein
VTRRVGGQGHIESIQRHIIGASRVDVPGDQDGTLPGARRTQKHAGTRRLTIARFKNRRQSDSIAQPLSILLLVAIVPGKRSLDRLR